MVDIILERVTNKLLDLLSDSNVTNEESHVFIGFSEEIPKKGKPYRLNVVWNSRVKSMETSNVTQIVKVNNEITLIKTVHSIIFVGKNKGILNAMNII